MGLLSIIWNKLVLKKKEVEFGENLRINGRMFVHGEKGRVVIGKNVTINSSECVNPTSGVNHTHLRTEHEGRIKIGNNVGISHASITSFSLVDIEDNVLIGSGVKIWDTDFHPLDYDSRIIGNREKREPILIKEGAFIGACSIILKGVTIGQHSVVGAGSVVSKSIPDNEIWAGSPAVFIRKLEV